MKQRVSLITLGVADLNPARLAEDSCVEDSGGWGGITPAVNVGSPAEVAHNPHWALTEDGGVRLKEE